MVYRTPPARIVMMAMRRVETCGAMLTSIFILQRFLLLLRNCLSLHARVCVLYMRT